MFHLNLQRSVKTISFFTLLTPVCWFSFQSTLDSYHSGAPWVRKFGYLRIQEILVGIKLSVNIRPFMLADVNCFTSLRAVVRKYRLGVCKMKKSKIPKLCQNIGLGKLFLEK